MRRSLRVEEEGEKFDRFKKQSLKMYAKSTQHVIDWLCSHGHSLKQEDAYE